MKKISSTPAEMGSAAYYLPFRDRAARSHDVLPRGAGSVGGVFSRDTSLADLAYVALPGLTSRVSRAFSVVSLANLTDAFSDLPAYESPVYIKGGLNANLALTVGVAMLSTFMYGYSMGNLNTPAGPIRAALGVPSEALTPDGVAVPMPSSDTIWSFVISIFSLGALVGCQSSARLADRWGRKTFLLWNSIIFVIGAVVEAAAGLADCAPTGGWEPCSARVAMLIAGRAVSGVACGGATVVVPMYVGEVSPAHLRGTLGAANQLMLVSGILVAQLIGLPAQLGTLSTWPIILGLPLAPALLQLLLQPMLFESPRWCAHAPRDCAAS